MQVIAPNWPAPTWIKAYSTTRDLGSLSTDKADDKQVALNRLRLGQLLKLPNKPIWLNQSHSNNVVTLNDNFCTDNVDGSICLEPNTVLAVKTADCLPVLITDSKGSLVCALHCGWRGLVHGIIDKAIKEIKTQTRNQIIVWLGPCISQDAYEVGPEVLEQFLLKNNLYNIAFKKSSNKVGKWFADLQKIAKINLQLLGVNNIHSYSGCTFAEKDKFYSYRRESKHSGRMVSLIWIGN